MDKQIEKNSIVMAQFSDERTTRTGNSSDPLKIEHGGREEPQNQAWPTPSTPTFQTKETQVADDQEQEVQQPQKKSMLQKVKERAKTYIHKHGYGHIPNDNKEEDDQHQSGEEEEGHDQFEHQEKEDTQSEKKEKAEDLNSNPRNGSSDVGSAVAPRSDASSTRNLSTESEATRDREVTNTGIPWKPRDPNVVSEGFEPRAASDRPASPIETMRGDSGEQELPTSPDQPSVGISPTLRSRSAVITPTLQSTEATSTPLEAQQVHDIGTTDTADLATHPVQGQFSQELPNVVPYNRRKEAPEVEFYGKDEPEKIDYNDPFPRSPRDPEVMMKSITEEPTAETLPIQQVPEDRWFDADDVVAGGPAVKDQNPSLSHVGSEKFGTAEPISDEPEYTDQDKLGGTGIKMQDDVSDESRDLKAQEANSEEFTENTGRPAALETATSIEGSKDKPTTDLDGIGLDENEKEEESKDEERAGNDESHMEKLSGMTSTENNANVASKDGNDEHRAVDEAPSNPDRIAEEENQENREKRTSYGNPVYDIDSTEKNDISSKLGYGEDQEREQEETEKRTEKLSADEEKGAHEESGKSLTDTPSADSVVSSNPAVEEKDEVQPIERYGDDDDVKTKSDGHEDTDAGKSYSDKMYATASTAKNAFYSTFGYGAKPVQAEQIHSAETKE